MVAKPLGRIRKVPAGVEDQPLLLSCPMTERDVHLWHVSVDSLLSHRLEFLKMLTEPEMVRARQCRTELEAQRYTAHRGLLRMILGYYLDLPPHEVGIEEHQRRPEIASYHQRDIRFSCACAFDWTFHTIYAISRKIDVGVDLARIHDAHDAELVAKLYLSPSEQAQLKALSGVEHDKLFARLWTRREALAKVMGHPLALSASAGGPPVSITPEGTSQQGRWKAGDWTVMDLEVWPGYAGALATKGSDWVAHHLRVPIPE